MTSYKATFQLTGRWGIRQLGQQVFVVFACGSYVLRIRRSECTFFFWSWVSGTFEFELQHIFASRCLAHFKDLKDAACIFLSCVDLATSFFQFFKCGRGSVFSSDNQQAYEGVDGAVVERTSWPAISWRHPPTLQHCKRKKTTQNHVTNLLR